jgi:hypothetical protein
LKQAQARREQARAAAAPAVTPDVVPAEAGTQPVIPAEAGTQPVIPAEAGTQPRTQEPGSPPSHGQPATRQRHSTPVIAATLATVIFLGVAFAWRSAPWKYPPKVRIDPAALKLEHNLDITRLRQTTPR